MTVLRQSCIGGGVGLDICYEDSHVVFLESAVEGVGGFVNVQVLSGYVGQSKMPSA